jgi:uncharacterized protein (TIGR03118 family)
MTVKAIMTSRGAALIVSLAGAAGLWAAGAVPARAETFFTQTNLVSDGSVAAKVIDPNLINPWGLAESPTTPFWVADNGTGLATIYKVTGGNVAKNTLEVTIPPGMGTGAPTGQVFNGGGGFTLKSGGSAAFLFDSEAGIISGWNGGTSAQIAVNNSASGAVYKGLAIDNAGGSLFAANFHSGQVEMYNSSFGLVKSFTDSTVLPGYAPFDVAVANGKLYVTFALQNAAKHDDVSGPGHGFVDVFSLQGVFEKRLISQGDLNSPWGLSVAPSSFGTFAGDLLVGNFGDGTIGAYNPVTGAFIDQLEGANGNPITITDLWALSIGNGVMGGSVNNLYFTAGLTNEAHGLFGSLTAIPEPSTWAMILIGFGFVAYWGSRRNPQLRAAQ